MKVVIAGVSGSLGTHLASRLLLAGHHVIGISRSDPKITGLEFIAHDLTKPRNIKHLSDAIVINSAAVTRDGFSQDILTTNQLIAKNCLLLSDGPQILISSSSVYDLRKPTRSAGVDEATGKYPFLNSYSKSKFQSEQIYAADNRASIILRPHALTGEGDQTLLPRLRRAIRFGSLRLPNGGRAMHEFTSFDNFSEAIELSLKKFETGFSGKKTLNVSDGRATKISEAIAKALFPDFVEIRSVPTPVAMAAGRVGELVALGGREPKISRYAVSQLAFDRTYDLRETKDFLGYAPLSD